MIRCLKSILPAVVLLCLPASGTASDWEAIPSGTQETLGKVFFTGPLIGFITGDHGTLLATLDGGKTWTPRELPFQEDLMSAWFTDARTGFLCGSHGLILRSNDSGRTWDSLPTPADILLNDIAFPSAGTGFAVGEGESLLVSRDSGTTWRTQAMPSVALPPGKTLVFPTASDGYLISISNMFRTRDAGLTWTQTGFSPGSAYLYEAYFFGPDTGFIADVTFGGLLGTTDGMQSYRSILPTQIKRIHFLDRKIGYATNGGDKCYRTEDGGESWSVDSSFNRRTWGTLQVTDLASSGDRAVILVGEKGLIARKEEDSGPSTALAGKPARSGIPSGRRGSFRADGRRNLRTPFQAPFPDAVQE